MYKTFCFAQPCLNNLLVHNETHMLNTFVRIPTENHPMLHFSNRDLGMPCKNQKNFPNTTPQRRCWQGRASRPSNNPRKIAVDDVLSKSAKFWQINIKVVVRFSARSEYTVTTLPQVRRISSGGARNQRKPKENKEKQWKTKENLSSPGYPGQDCVNLSLCRDCTV